MLNCDDDGKPVVADNDKNDFEIRAGLCYGLWMKKDLVWIHRLGKYWQPVTHGSSTSKGRWEPSWPPTGRRRSRLMPAADGQRGWFRVGNDPFRQESRLPTRADIEQHRAQL